MRTRRSGLGRSGAGRSAARTRSCSWSSYGIATCPPTTPDGSLPDVDPDVESETRAQGSAQARSLNRDALAIARQWRERATAEDLSIRELVIEMTSRRTFVGSPATVAAALVEHVEADACDGFILVPHITPGGLDRFADEVVPLLQERGAFRTEYTGTTLRDHLGLRLDPPRQG